MTLSYMNGQDRMNCETKAYVLSPFKQIIIGTGQPEMQDNLIFISSDIVVQNVKNYHRIHSDSWCHVEI